MPVSSHSLPIIAMTAIQPIPIMCAWPVSSPLPVSLRAIQSPALIFAFLIGYAGIIMEEELSFNKSGVALLMAVFLWTIRSLTGDHAAVGPLLMPLPCLQQPLPHAEAPRATSII